MRTLRIELVLLALLASAACQPADDLAWPTSSARRVLLVTFDTTRADRIGAYDELRARGHARTPSAELPEAEPEGV